MDIAVVTMVKLNSERCRHKLLRPLLPGLSVLEHHFRLVRSLEFADGHYVFTREPELDGLIRKHDLDRLDRSMDSARSHTFHGIWAEAAEQLRGASAILWVNACCPFLRPETLARACGQRKVRVDERVMIPCYEAERPYWDRQGKPIADRARPESGDDAVLALSHAFWLRTPAQVLATAEAGVYARQHREARLFRLDSQVERLDIDTEEDLLTAQALAGHLLPRDEQAVLDPEQDPAIIDVSPG